MTEQNTALDDIEHSMKILALSALNLTINPNFSKEL
tara:strand:- start:1106 stop:1213 length:108 start_codon:yes stop_codon:yes gene_type:complete